MKILIVANRAKWKSWPDKIEKLESYFKKFDIKATIEHTAYNTVPYIKYESNDPRYGVRNYEGIDPDWYDKYVTSMASGYDIVLFVLPLSQWNKDNGARGWRTDKDQGPVQLHIWCDENEKAVWGGYAGRTESFFQLARHEILHALYMITGQLDKVHDFWDAGNLDLALDDLKISTPKDVEIVGILQQIVLIYQQIITLFKKKKEEEINQYNEKHNSKLDEWAFAIRDFEGWEEGEIIRLDDSSNST